MKAALKAYFKVSNPVDKWLFWVLVGLLFAGFLIFLSASIGLHAREGASFGSITLSRLIATAIGIAVAYVASIFHYKHLRRYTFAIFLVSIVFTSLIFVPGLGVEHGGARRWISILGFSFQPAELMKIAFVIYAAALFSSAKDKIQDFSSGPLPLLALLIAAGLLLLLQPDTDTFVVLFIAILSMFVVAGGRIRHIGIIGLIGLLGLSALILSRPYLKERVITFINPASDLQGAGWQINQSLIAVGSGGVWGKGFGQSVQKFSFLPEPIGDSIFAVAAEE